MAYRDLFSEKEWATLEISVLWIFQAVAGADKKVDVQELDALSFVQDNSDKFRNDLLKEVLSSLKYHIDNISTAYEVDTREIGVGLREMADLLEDKIPSEEALLFKKSLLAIGMYVAFASGDIFSSKMSNLESQIIIELSLYMRISKQEYRESPTVEELMKRFST